MILLILFLLHLGSTSVLVACSSSNCCLQLQHSNGSDCPKPIRQATGKEHHGSKAAHVLATTYLAHWLSGSIRKRPDSWYVSWQRLACQDSSEVTDECRAKRDNRQRNDIAGHWALGICMNMNKLVSCNAIGAPTTGTKHHGRKLAEAS